MPSDDSKKSIHLTVKMPASKLREATSGSKRNGAINSRDSFEPGEILTGPRGSRAKRAIVEDSESEDEDEADDDEGDGNGYNDEDEDEDEEDAQGESEDVDAEGDVDMDDAPPPPVIKATSSAGAKPTVTVTPAIKGKLKSVEAKEMETVDNDDEELSELDSDDDEVEEEEAMDEGDVEEDAEGEADDVDEGDEGDELDEEDSDDDATPGPGSRASTPDITKLTKRQRSRLDEVMNADLLALPSGMLYAAPLSFTPTRHRTGQGLWTWHSQKANRRRFSPQKSMLCVGLRWLGGGKRSVKSATKKKRCAVEQPRSPVTVILTYTHLQMDTINKLLKKQAPKQRRARAAETAGDATPNSQEAEVEKAKSTVVRWISNREGSKVGVPEEWLGASFGRVFESAQDREKMARRAETHV